MNFVYDLVVRQSSARCISLVLHDPIDEKKNDDLVSSTTGSSALHCKERKISFLSLSQIIFIESFQEYLLYRKLTTTKVSVFIKDSIVSLLKQ